MAIDVNKPSSSDYLTKPTSQAPTSLCRDHQHNKNQTIRTITTQDQASAIPVDISSVVFASEDDFHKITLEHIFPDTSDDDDDDDQFTPSMFDIFPIIETTTATTSGTATAAAMTLEEFQQWEDEHYEAEDRAEEAINPTSKWILLAAALDADIFAPIEETTTATITENDDTTDATTTTTETTTRMPTMIEDIAAADTPIHTDTLNTTIEEAAEQQQKPTHTQSKNRQVPVISNKNMNKNKKKEKQKTATLKMTHMPVIIEEEPKLPTTKTEEDKFSYTTTDETTTAMIIENHDIFNAQPMIEEEPNPPIIDNTTTTGDEEETRFRPARSTWTTNSLLVILQKKKKMKRVVMIIMIILITGFYEMSVKVQFYLKPTLQHRRPLLQTRRRQSRR